MPRTRSAARLDASACGWGRDVSSGVGRGLAVAAAATVPNASWYAAAPSGRLDGYATWASARSAPSV
jgi:hypothetical protein